MRLTHDEQYQLAITNVSSMIDYWPYNEVRTMLDIKNRRMVKRFKRGDKSTVLKQAENMAEMIKRLGYDSPDYTLLCVPASSEHKHEKRYKLFSNALCMLTGMTNGYDFVQVHGKRDAIHKSVGRIIRNNDQRICVNECELYGRNVIIFDDVITTGKSFASFALRIEQAGANVVEGVFLGRTRKKIKYYSLF